MQEFRLSRSILARRGGLQFEVVTAFRFLQVLFAIGQAARLAAVERRQHLPSSQIVERDAGPVTIAKDAGEDGGLLWGWARRGTIPRLARCEV